MRLLAVFFALLLIILPSAAQSESDTRHGLLTLLRAAPDIPDIRTVPIIASFADYHAGLASHGIDIPASYADFQALDADSQAALLWSLPSAGPESFLRSFMSLAEMSAVMGFDFFQIAQAIEIGTAPGNGVILAGEFDSQAIVDAHLARSYTEQPDEFGPMLCGAEGCDSGYETDFANILDSNPFGGRLGQSQPLIVTESMILNSRSLPLLTSMSEAARTRISSMAEAKDVQAAANILSYRDYVNAIVLASPAAVNILDATASSGRFSNFMGKLESLPPLPAYSLISLSYTVDEGYEYGDILLIYPDIDTASHAYESVMARLSVVESVTVDGRTIEQLFNETGEFLPPQVITDEKTNLSALQLTIRTPLEGTAPEDYGRSFRRLMQLLAERDTVLLLPTP